MNFIPSRNRDRHLFVDETMERYTGVSMHPDVQELVGATSIEFMAQLSGQLVVPDVRHGTAQVTESSRRTGMYVLAILPGESVTFAPDLMVPSAFQLQRTEAALSITDMSKSDIATMLASLQKGAVGVQASHRSSIYAWVQSKQYVAEGAGGFHAVDGTPVMLLPFSKNPGYTAPNVIAHELTHVKQMVFSPVLSAASKAEAFTIKEDQRLRCELEAYHRETAFIEGMVASGYQPGRYEQTGYIVGESGRPSSMAAHITNICFRANGASDDLYAPSTAVREALAAKELDYIYAA